MNKEEKAEVTQLLRMAHFEIEELRQKVENLTPRAQAYDTIQILASQMEASGNSAARPDPLWRIKNYIDGLDKTQE